MEGGTKHDDGKPRLGLVPPDALVLAAKVFTFGARKYADWNWTKGFDWSRLDDAGMRHLAAWRGGESLDPESGLPHLGHALCCYMMLAAHELRGLGHDDRHVIKGGSNPRRCGVKTPLGLCGLPCENGWTVCEGHLPDATETQPLGRGCPRCHPEQYRDGEGGVLCASHAAG